MNDRSGATAYRRRDEKPRRRRLEVDIVCDLSFGEIRATGQVHNLCLDGCLIHSPCAFPLRETVELLLDFAGGTEPLALRGQVRWMALGRSEGSVSLGIRFVHTEDTTRKLEKFLMQMIRRPQPAAQRAPRATYSEPGGLKLMFASEEIGRLLSPGPSAPLPGSPAGPLEPLAPR